jgi:hypothetical protein
VKLSDRSLPSCTTFQFGVRRKAIADQYLFGILGTKESSDIFTDDHPPDANGEIGRDLVLVVVFILVDVVLRLLGLGGQALPGVCLGLDILLVGLPLIVPGRGARGGGVDGICVVISILHTCTTLGAHGEVLGPVGNGDGSATLALGALPLLPLFLARRALRDGDEDTLASEGGAVLAGMRLRASRLTRAALDA